MSNRLFITGMFRSGTTLLARMLHTHDEIVCASDPFRPFFNCFRDAVARDLGAPVGGFDPLDDYFADKTGLAVFEGVQQATLERSFPNWLREELRERIISHAEPFSPKITERLDSIQGATFREVYDDLLSHIPAAYGNGAEQWEATKEVWTTEFTPVLARAYPESKFLHVVRDPRAVCASKNVKKNSKYPWLFLIRQWRKLATLSDLYESRFKDRVCIVRYEDLVQNPRNTVEEICNFLGIVLDEAILDPSNYVDGAGDPWLQNTSYERSSRSFNIDSVDKWREVLSGREKMYIEQLSYPEMLILGYEIGGVQFGLPDDMVFNPPRVSTNKLADWVRGYYEDWDRIRHSTEIGTEQVRHRLLTTDDCAFDNVGEQVLKGYFLDPSHASTVRTAVREHEGTN